MQFLRKVLYFLIAVAMLALGASFAVQNDATVPLNLLVVQLPEHSIALWVLLAFAIGGVVGLLSSLGMILRQRTALAAANRKLAKIRGQVAIETENKQATESKPVEPASASALQES